MKGLNILDKILWSLFMMRMQYRGYKWCDLKHGKDGELEAVTFSNNEEYINRISEIE